jgi:hypothetical protein
MFNQPLAGLPLRRPNRLHPPLPDVAKDTIPNRDMMDGSVVVQFDSIGLDILQSQVEWASDFMSGMVLLITSQERAHSR